MRLRRRQDEQQPQEISREQATRLRALADLFVDEAEVAGFDLDYSPDGLRAVDELTGELGEGADADAVNSRSVSAGAYLGEVIVRSGGGRWVLVPGVGYGVRLVDGQVAFPMNKAAKRMTEGPEHDLLTFFVFATTGQLPPDGRITRFQPPGR